MGVHTHYDVNDNIVIQMAGRKRWRLAPNRHVANPTVVYRLGERPTPAHRAEAPNGLPSDVPKDVVTHELSPGSVMFVPRGYWHDCETTDDESLHLNIQLGVPRWKDLAEFCFAKLPLLRSDAMRGATANLFSEGHLRPHVRQELLRRLQALTESLTEADLDIGETEFEAFGAQARSAID